MHSDVLLKRSHKVSMSHMVEEACRQWQACRQQNAAQHEAAFETSRPFSIALSREVGTQGTQVARAVGQLLGWQVYDHELLEHIAKEMGLRVALLESVDERHQSWMRETIGASLASLASGGKAPWASESSFVHHLVETVLALGSHGNCVIVGRGSAVILPAETTLRVRLMGPINDRIATYARMLGISERDAAEKVKTTDLQRTEFVQDHFSKDPADPRNYDLILNASRLTVTQCAELIVEALRRVQTPVAK